MRFAYADPPYVGQSRKHYGRTEVNHRLLIAHLVDEFPNGWALSCSTPSLRELLPLCPQDVRVGAWVKPFAIFKPNVNPGYAWEAVIFRGGRKRRRDEPTIRDWVSVNITLLGAKFKFDALKDLTPIVWTASVPLVLAIHPSVPAKTVKDLVALSKRDKRGLNGGHNGSGTTSHIALEMFRQQTGAQAESIGYKGGGPGTIAVLAGEIDFTFATLTTVKPHLESGRLRGLAVSTKKRSSVFPDLPTMDSIYPGFESDNWFGLFAPTSVAKEIIARLNALSLEALRGAEMRDIIARDGGDVVGSSPEELGAHLRSEVARYAPVIKAGNIKSD